MKKFTLFQNVLTILIFAIGFVSASAQRQFNAETRSNPPRVDLLRELNLTNAQIRQIGEIRRRQQPAIRAARERLQNANRALDAAVYAEDFDETEIQARLRETQAAQAEVIQSRIATETAIRRILSPAQLARFRQLRLEFVQPAENRRNRNQMQRRNLPLRRLGTRRRVPR